MGSLTAAVAGSSTSSVTEGVWGGDGAAVKIPLLARDCGGGSSGTKAPLGIGVTASSSLLLKDVKSPRFEKSDEDELPPF